MQGSDVLIVSGENSFGISVNVWSLKTLKCLRWNEAFNPVSLMETCRLLESTGLYTRKKHILGIAKGSSQEGGVILF